MGDYVSNRLGDECLEGDCRLTCQEFPDMSGGRQAESQANTFHFSEASLCAVSRGLAVGEGGLVWYDGYSGYFTVTGERKKYGGWSCC